MFSFPNMSAKAESLLRKDWLEKWQLRNIMI